VITFLEFVGAKLSSDQREMSPIHEPFSTNGELRTGEGLNKNVADSRTNDPTEHPKVNRLRIGASQLEILNNGDLQQICNKYKITDLDPTHPKKLSNMPITIKFDINKNCYVLTKDE